VAIDIPIQERGLGYDRGCEIVPASLQDVYGEKDLPWKEKTEPIIRFCESETGEVWGFPFFSLSAARLIPHEQPYSAAAH
jgi:hypothetical protein